MRRKKNTESTQNSCCSDLLNYVNVNLLLNDEMRCQYLYTPLFL